MYFFVFAAAAVALYFVVSAFRGPRPGVIIAAIVWLAYAVYEYFIANGTLCDANCNIRVDLLLILPLLGLVSLFGIYPPGRWSGDSKLFAKLGFGFFAVIAALVLYLFLAPASEQPTPTAASATSTP